MINVSVPQLSNGSGSGRDSSSSIGGGSPSAASHESAAFSIYHQFTEASRLFKNQYLINLMKRKVDNPLASHLGSLTSKAMSDGDDVVKL